MSDNVASATNGEVVTPSDSADLAAPTRGLYVGVGGDVVVVMNGVTVTFKNAVAGTILPIRVTRVKATGTTATTLVGLS